MSTLEASTSRATSVLPTCGPPTRKYTSDSVVGFAGDDQPNPWPTRSSTGDFDGPASNVTPATTTPGTLATSSGIAPWDAVRVACPSPRTTVSGRHTRMLEPMS